MRCGYANRGYQQYVATAELVKVHPVEELVQQMIEHRSVSKDDILASCK